MSTASIRAPRTDGVRTNDGVRKRKREAGADEDEFEWETSKENVMPLKRGRKVPDLNRALRAHDSFLEKVRLDEQATRYEDKIRGYKGDDPLSAWTDYIRWIETSMPEDTRKKFGVLEKGTRALKDNPRYKNDMRYIRLWIQYADLVSNPKDIFKYLYQNKIGEFVSLFYIGWAWVLESVGNYPQAHKIYVKATQKNAAPQELLARKYKEFQRRMSRHWMRVNEESESNQSGDANERYALENISAFDPVANVGDTQLQQHRQQLSFSRAESVRRANAHKPVFIVYEDPVVDDVDPFDSNIGWSTLDTVQNQNKENDLAPRPWNAESRAPAVRDQPSAQRASSAFEVFADDEYAPSAASSSFDRRAMTNRSRTLRQRIEGVSTEEEQLAQQPLKNFSSGADSRGSNASSKPVRKSKTGSTIKSEVIGYDIHQLKAHDEGDLLSFEEVRAQSFKRKRKSSQPDVSPLRRAVSQPRSQTAAEKLAVGSTRSTFLAPSNAAMPKEPPSTKVDGFSFVNRKSATGLTGSGATSKYANLDAAAQEDVTINTRVAMEDINGMFCSPQRPSRSQATEAREDDPVERKLHFSIFDDSVDSVAANTQDQSVHQGANESAAEQSFQVFVDDDPDVHQTSSTKSQPRKALQSRDDLVQGVRLTNKDIILQMQAKTNADEGSKQPPKGGSVVIRNERMTERVTPEMLRDRELGKKLQLKNATLKRGAQAVEPVPEAPPLQLDPFESEHRKIITESESVQAYLQSRSSAVTKHPRRLPRLPLANTMKRRFKNPTIVQIGEELTLEVTGLLGSGGFAHVFAASVPTDQGNTLIDVAVKIETQRSTLAWEFYVLNKLRGSTCKDNTSAAVPRPVFHSLHLYSNGSMLIMDKGCAGTLHDLLNTYKKLGKTCPEPLAVYYGIRMLQSIENMHAANILHGDIKPDNWLVSPGSPSSVLTTGVQLRTCQAEFEAGDLCLIDFGRAIDLSAYPIGTKFVGDCHTKGFQCVEMLSARPWTFQIDSFGFLSTMHCILFGEYMKVQCQHVRGKPARWTISKPFKRYWQVEMWTEIFDTLLNIPSCSKQPSLPKLRHRLEGYFFDRRRRQALCDQLAQQERFLSKPKI